MYKPISQDEYDQTLYKILTEETVNYTTAGSIGSVWHMDEDDYPENLVDCE
jgi:hypothetical protein